MTSQAQTELVVTHFVAGDKDRWRELWLAYLAFYHTTVPETTIASTWQRVLDQSGSLRGLGARRGQSGELVGIVHFLSHESAWNTKQACYLQDLFVAPSMRGRGVGRLLIEAVADKARALGYYNLYWLTQESNNPARLLYDSLAKFEGFVCYEFDYDKQQK
jgi:GNAT superfamily N-acetyltransferase